MKLLRDKILKQGKVLSSNVIKVDSFLNHQVDPILTMEIGKAFANVFRKDRITKVLTIEASGIHFAFATAAALGVPFVYAKKKKAITLTEEVYSASVFSFTRRETYQISVSKNYLAQDDRVLIIDDILATGEALFGLCSIVAQSGAKLIGVGTVLEKSFQEGRGKLEDAGVRVHSLARIASMSPEGIQFIEEDSSEKETSTVC